MRVGISMHQGNRSTDRLVLGDGGFSMIATALSLLATAVLTAILLGTMLNTSGGTSNGSISNAPGVAEATAIQAQQTLSTGLTAADAAAATAGGYGSLQPSALTASNPSINFVTGPSTNSDTVSMAVVSGVESQAGSSVGSSSGGGAGATSGIGGYAGSIAAATGAASAASGGTSQVGSGASGAITLADRSTDGTCWLVWRAAGGGTWYGAQTRQPTCTAPGIASTPSPGPVTSTTIGWQQGSFPGV